MDNFLDKISQNVKQKIYECIFQALCEDSQEADAHLGLKTHVSRPFMNWDLMYRNLINAFGDDNVKYATNKRGMWTVLLLYDVESGLLITFIRDTRFESIKHLKRDKQPQYIRSLIALNNELQATNKQLTLLDDIANSESKNETELMKVLYDLCSGFDCPIEFNGLHHVLVCFSNKYKTLSSLQAYILDSNFDIIEEQNWLDMAKPMMSNEFEVAEREYNKPAITLKSKATDRLKEKGLVALKEKEKQKQS
ncbi:hypothetical protein B5F08_06625 [Anaeromassilibacillus sp. An172]|uniref:DUF5986 family protein n=1 Tax=Anaeromassilibacillus sp. An172 TaxID=1965570 RepID=UPI000B3AD747|nr:DUF5986 family protein [Anaeromassilibacillus sp. An172]OUP78741.1 hypothetical protein B5F08_06625 [Anaeromassilibacillus sp. An172]